MARKSGIYRLRPRSDWPGSGTAANEVAPAGPQPAGS